VRCVSKFLVLRIVQENKQGSFFEDTIDKFYAVFLCRRLFVDGKTRSSARADRGRMHLASGVSLERSDVIYDVKWSSRLDHVLARRTRDLPGVT